MAAVPADAPLTMPPVVTVAFDELLLQVPPPTLADNVILLPAHTVEAPIMVPAAGRAFTVTTLVTVVVPQPLLTI